MSLNRGLQHFRAEAHLPGAEVGRAAHGRSLEGTLCGVLRSLVSLLDERGEGPGRLGET